MKPGVFLLFFWVTERALFSITSPLHYKYLTFSVKSKCTNVFGKSNINYCTTDYSGRLDSREHFKDRSLYIIRIQSIKCPSMNKMGNLIPFYYDWSKDPIVFPVCLCFIRLSSYYRASLKMRRWSCLLLRMEITGALLKDQRTSPKKNQACEKIQENVKLWSHKVILNI